MVRTQLANSWKEWARLNRGELDETAPTVGGAPSNILATKAADLAADLVADLSADLVADLAADLAVAAAAAAPPHP